MYLFKQDRSPYWHTEFQHKGKKIRRSTGESNKNTALKVARALKKEYANNATKTVVTNQYTYIDGLIRWLETDCPASMRSHAKNTRELENVPLVDVVVAAHAMKEQMAKRLKKDTVNRRLSCVRRILNKAYKEWGWLDQPLGDKISLFPDGPGREIYLEPPEFQEFLTHIKSVDVRRFVCIAAHTGLRRSELHRLTPKNFKAPYIILPNNTKSKKPRTVPLIEELHDSLTLPWPCSLHQIRRGFEKAREKMGIEHVRLHDLRHTFASWIASNPEIPLTTLRDLLGHSSLAVTSKYAHLRGQHFEAVSRSLSPPTNPPTTLVTH